MIDQRSSKVRVKYKKTVFTFSLLHNAAGFAFEQARGQKEGRALNLLSYIVFSAFCMEAYLNHIGEYLFCHWKKAKYWADLERLSPRTKLEIIGHELGLNIEWGKRPFSSFERLIKIRNRTAHGKTEVLEGDSIWKITGAIIERERTREKTSSIEEELEKEIRRLGADKAGRFLSDIESIINILQAEMYCLLRADIKQRLRDENPGLNDGDINGLFSDELSQARGNLGPEKDPFLRMSEEFGSRSSS